MHIIFGTLKINKNSPPIKFYKFDIQITCVGNFFFNCPVWPLQMCRLKKTTIWQIQNKNVHNIKEIGKFLKYKFLPLKYLSTILLLFIIISGHHGHDRMIVGFITTYAISA